MGVNPLINSLRLWLGYFLLLFFRLAYLKPFLRKPPSFKYLARLAPGLLLIDFLFECSTRSAVGLPFRFVGFAADGVGKLSHAVLIAPWWEELTRLNIMSVAPMSALHAASFALAHQQPDWSVLLITFSWGLVLTAVTFRSGSVWNAVAAHMLVNLSTFGVAGGSELYIQRTLWLGLALSALLLYGPTRALPQRS